MKHIRNFHSYRNSYKISEKRINETVKFLSQINLSNSDEKLFIDIFNKRLDNYRTDESIKSEIRIYLNENQLLNEGFFDKLKSRFPKAAQVSKKLSDKAENILGQVLKASKDTISFVKKFSDSIKDILNRVIANSKKYFEEQIKRGKLKSKIEEVVKTNKGGLVTDLKTSKKVIDFYRKDFLKNLIKVQKQKMSEFLSKEQTPISESMINEGGNVIATLIHGIERIPPFSWLHEVSKAGEKGANALIGAISNLTKKLGGPEFKLPVIAVIIGSAIEIFVKEESAYLLKKSSSWLFALAGYSNPLGVAIYGIKKVAKVVTFIVVLDAVLGQLLLGSQNNHSSQAQSSQAQLSQSDI